MVVRGYRGSVENERKASGYGYKASVLVLMKMSGVFTVNVLVVIQYCIF